MLLRDLKADSVAKAILHNIQSLGKDNKVELFVSRTSVYLEIKYGQKWYTVRISDHPPKYECNKYIRIDQYENTGDVINAIFKWLHKLPRSR